MPVRPRLETTRRERVVNYGNDCKTQADGVASLFHMSQEDGRPFLVTVECSLLTIPPAVALTGDFRPYIHMAWGHGGADVEADFEVTYRQRITVAASTVDVKAGVRSLPLAQSNGTFLQPTVPPTVLAEFRAFVSEGPDANPLFPTFWLTSLGANKGNFVGPSGIGMVLGQQCRMATVRAFANAVEGGAQTVYLQLFDQPTVPANGDIPVDVFPMNVPPFTEPHGPLPVPLGQTRAFTKGCAWAISTSPYLLTLDANSTAFITAEFLT